MTAVARTVRGEEDGLALHDELTRAFGIATLGEVHDLARAISLDHSTVRVLPAAMTDIVSEDPLAVRAPVIADIAVGVGVVELLVEDLVVTARLEVVDVNTRAVTQVSHLRAVGREVRLERCFLILRQLRLLDVTRIDEEGVIRAIQLSHIDIPPAITLSSVDDLLAIVAEVDITLFFGGAGEALRRAVFGVSDEDITVDDEGNFLIAGSYGKGRHAITDRLRIDCRFLLVTDDGDIHLRGLTTRRLSVDLAIEAIAERTIRGNREEADGILREGSDLLVCSGSRSSITMIDIEGAFALTEVVEASLAIPDSITVFTAEGRELRVLTILGAEPDITCHRRDSVLTPDIFVALDVSVEDLATTQRRHQHRISTVELGAGNSLREVKRVGLYEPVPGIHTILHIGHDVGLEEERRAIEEGDGHFLLAAIGQATQARAVSLDDIDVLAPFTIRGEGQRTAVGAPNRGTVIGGIRGKA